MERINDFAGPHEPPSRIHGDLWSGNVVWSSDGSGYLVDPAAHGGHRETDLAMLALFGAPHLARLLEAYDEAAPLARRLARHGCRCTSSTRCSCTPHPVRRLVRLAGPGRPPAPCWTARPATGWPDESSATCDPRDLSAASQTVRGRLERMRILVVDDDRAVRDSLRRSLEFNGYEVALANDGVEALARINGLAPDALIVDVMMPRLDGIETTKALRAAGNDLPILVLTARDSVNDRVDGLDAGADDYLAKPFALDELLARVRAMLRRRNLGTERRRRRRPAHVRRPDDEPGHARGRPRRSRRSR